MTNKYRGPTGKICNNYKNTKLKLLKKNAAILFNKIFKTKQLTPKYEGVLISP